MNNILMYKLKQSVGYVFNKKKLVVTIPVGDLHINKNDIEKQLDIINWGPYASLPCESIGIAEINIEFITQMFREKPETAIIVIDEVSDVSTGEILENQCNSFKEQYNSELSYIEKGYEVKTIFELNKCIENYLVDENFEHCTILNVEASKFDLKSLLVQANKNMCSINGVSEVRKSKVVNHIFVAPFLENDSNDIDNIINDVIYNNTLLCIPYMYFSEEDNCCIKSIEGDIDISEIDFEDEEQCYKLFGEMDINSDTIVSYLVSCSDEIVNVKIIYFKGISQGPDKLYEIIEKAGYFKEIMANYLNNFIEGSEPKAISINSLEKNEFIIANNELDLVSLIKKFNENLGWNGKAIEFISFLYSLGKCYVGNELDEELELDKLISYLKEDEKNAIFIPIAVSDMEGGVILANKKIIQESEVCMGSIELYEDTAVGLITTIINDKYKFIIAEFNACTGSYEITKDYGVFGKEVIELIDKFIIKE